MAVRVCHVTSVHPAKDDRIFYKECISLAKEYEVYLLAPNVPDELSQGVHIVGVSLPKGRIYRLLSLKKVFRQAAKIDAEVYHFHDPELMRVGLKLQKLGKRVIFDSHEDVPMQLLTKEYLPPIVRKAVSKLYEKYEKRCLSHYDALVSVTPFIVERLSSVNPNVFMITNYPIVKQFSGNHKDMSSKYVCFAGGVSQRYMHEYVINSLEYTQSKYLLAGPAYPKYLEKLQQMDMWKKVEYKGVLKYEEVNSLYAKAFAGIVLLDYSPNVGYHKGTLGVLKMFEYMIAGLPVIATDFELWKEIIEGNRCGKCIDPHDIKAISDAINYYQNNPEIAAEDGERGRQAVLSQYNWESQEKVLFDLYSWILNL